MATSQHFMKLLWRHEDPPKWRHYKDRNSDGGHPYPPLLTGPHNITEGISGYFLGDPPIYKVSATLKGRVFEQFILG